MGVHCSRQNQAHLLMHNFQSGRSEIETIYATLKYKNKLRNSDETDKPKVVGTSSHIGFLNLRLVEFKYASLECRCYGTK